MAAVRSALKTLSFRCAPVALCVYMCLGCYENCQPKCIGCQEIAKTEPKKMFIELFPWRTWSGERAREKSDALWSKFNLFSVPVAKPPPNKIAFSPDLPFHECKTPHDVSAQAVRALLKPSRVGALGIIYHSPHGNPQKTFNPVSRGVFIVDVIALWLEKISLVFRVAVCIQTVVYFVCVVRFAGAIFDFFAPIQPKLLFCALCSRAECADRVWAREKSFCSLPEPSCCSCVSL